MKHNVFIGTYTKENSRGIYHGTFENGRLAVEGAQPAVNPSYLTVHGNGLYAVEETNDGAAVSFAMDSLSPTGRQKVLGDDPCHVLTDGQWLYVSNYTSGSLASFRLVGGRIEGPPNLLRHTGSSVNPRRQRTAHVHQAAFTPDGQYLAVCDLGMDKVLFYPRDRAGIHTPAEEVDIPLGAGPRHAVFGSDGIWYVVCELSCDVLVYRGYGSHSRLRHWTKHAAGYGKRRSFE